MHLTFVQNLIAFYSRPEEMNDVIAGANVVQVTSTVHVKLADSRSSRSRDIPLAHFDTKDDNDDDDAASVRSQLLL